MTERRNRPPHLVDLGDLGLDEGAHLLTPRALVDRDPNARAVLTYARNRRWCMRRPMHGAAGERWLLRQVARQTQRQGPAYEIHRARRAPADSRMDFPELRPAE
jgi:hypothetical protein